MAIEQIEQACWILTCDKCGENDEGENGGPIHWGSKEACEKYAIDTGCWHKRCDGSWICDSCHSSIIENPDCTECQHGRENGEAMRCTTKSATISAMMVYGESMEWPIRFDHTRMLTCDSFKEKDGQA